MENILKPKGMLCNRKLHAGRPSQPGQHRPVHWSTGQHTGRPMKISILQVKVDVYIKLLHNIFWSTGRHKNMGKIMK